MSALVSVILTCFNGERWIGETIRSVLAQSHGELELVVVDDGSSDGSREVVRSFRDARLRPVAQENRGIPAARNRGLEEARGELISVLDQDDPWYPDKLAAQVRCLAERPEAGVVYANADHIDESGRFLRRRFETQQPEGWLLRHFLRRGVAVPIVTTLIRRACLDRVGRFNERLYGSDDYELLVRLAAEFRFAYLPAPLARLRYHAGSAWRDERMFLDRFLVADALAGWFPEHRRLVRRYRSRVHYEYGLYLSARADRGQARAHFRRAIRTRPGFWRAYLRWLESMLRGVRRLPWSATRVRA